MARLFMVLMYEKIEMKRAIAVSFLCCTVQAASVAAELSDGRSTITVQELKKEILVLAPEFRDHVLGSKDKVQQFAATVLANKRIEEAARQAGIHKRPEIQAKIENAIRDILGKQYLSEQFDAIRADAPDMTRLAREEYEIRKNDYLKPPSVWASHILLRVDPEDPKRNDEQAVKAKAEKVLDELRKGADFAQKAREISEERLAPKTGGDMGWVDKGKFVPLFEEVVFALEPGQMSGLVRTRFGFHIIKLHDKRDGRLTPFENVKHTIIKKLKDKYVSDRREEVMARFQGTVEIKVDDAVMAELDQ